MEPLLSLVELKNLDCFLHRKRFEALQGIGVHRLGLRLLFGRLAKHWALAEEPERAVIYLEKAADIASQQFSNEEVIPSRCF